MVYYYTLIQSFLKDGTGRDEAGWEETGRVGLVGIGWDGALRNGTGRDRMCWDRMGWDGTGRDEMGWD